MIADPVFADMLESDAPAHPHSHDHGAHDGGHSHDAHAHGHGHSRDAHSHGHSHDAAPSSNSGSSAASASASAPASASGSGTKASGPSQRDRDLQQDKVRSTLRSFVRDWAVEGAAERQACYDPIVAALEEHYPDVSARGKVKVLVPGCGLGRLAMEIAARGFWAQGNEFSTYMLIGSHFALNQWVVSAL